MDILINNSNTNYDIWLLAISTIAASAMIFISFVFLDRLYRSKDSINGFLPFSISLIAGTGLWGNHQLILLSKNLGVPTRFSWAMVHSWLFAVAITACIVYLTGVRNSKLQHLLLGGIVGGDCDCDLFFTRHLAIDGTQSISVEPAMAIVATLYALVVVGLQLHEFPSIKNYTV